MTAVFIPKPSSESFWCRQTCGAVVLQSRLCDTSPRNYLSHPMRTRAALARFIYTARSYYCYDYALAACCCCWLLRQMGNFGKGQKERERRRFRRWPIAWWELLPAQSRLALNYTHIMMMIIYLMANAHVQNTIISTDVHTHTHSATVCRRRGRRWCNRCGRVETLLRTRSHNYYRKLLLFRVRLSDTVGHIYFWSLDTILCVQCCCCCSCVEHVWIGIEHKPT